MSAQLPIYLNASDVETAQAAKEHMQRIEEDMFRCRWVTSSLIFMILSRFWLTSLQQAEETRKRLQSQVRSPIQII